MNLLVIAMRLTSDKMIGQPCYEKEKLIQLIEQHHPEIFLKEEKDLLKHISTPLIKWISFLRLLCDRYEDFYFVEIDL